MRGKVSLAPRAILAGAAAGGIGLVAGVINDARARQRRHRESGAILLLLIVLLVGLNVGGAGANHRLSASRPPLAHAAQAALPPVQIRYLMPCSGASTWWAPCP